MRSNNSNAGIVKGNLNIRFSDESIENIQKQKWSGIEVISWILDLVDTYFIGEEFCLSNFDMGAMLYSAYQDKVYILSFGSIYEKLMKGKVLKLYAAEPTKEDREKIEEWM